MLRHTFSIEWEYAPTEFSALLAELRLIKRHRPQFNTTYVSDEWPRAYIALTNGPVAGLRIVPRSDDPRAVSLFGPFRKISAVREAVRALADATMVRDCTLEESKPGRAHALWFASDEASAANGAMKGKLRTRAPGCLRYELGSCAGPCIGEGNAVIYRAAVDEIKRFLEGKSRWPLDQLQTAMEASAARLEFERAAVLRDRLASVDWLYKRVRQFRANVDRLTFRYHARTPEGIERIYLIRRGTVRCETTAPACDAERVAFETMASRIYDGPDPTGADIPVHDLDEFYLVASWFRRHPEELNHTYPAMALT